MLWNNYYLLTFSLGWKHTLTDWNEFLAEDLQNSRDAPQECFVQVGSNFFNDHTTISFKASLIFTTLLIFSFNIHQSCWWLKLLFCRNQWEPHLVAMATLKKTSLLKQLIHRIREVLLLQQLSNCFDSIISSLRSMVLRRISFVIQVHWIFSL